MAKRVLAMLLGAVMALSITACGGGNAAAPEITEMPSYDNLNEVLTGDYAITEDTIAVYCTDVLNGAGLGLVEADRDVVQEGDIVLVDYTGYKDGVAFSGGAATNQWIDVTGNCSYDTSTGASGSYYIEGFTDGLVGAKIEEKVSSDVTFPENYDSTELAGADTVFEFVVHGIYEPVTLESLTDTFVEEKLKENYEVSTVEEFKVFLEEELAYNFVMNYLILNSTFEIPDAYLDERVAAYQEYFKELNCPEVELEEYLSYYGYTLEDMQIEWKTALESQVKAELVFAKVVADQGLTLDEEGHNEYVQSIIAVNSAYFPDADSIHKYAGAGSAAEGEAYLKNQTASRNYMLEKYRNTAN